MVAGKSTSGWMSVDARDSRRIKAATDKFPKRGAQKARTLAETKAPVRVESQSSRRGRGIVAR